MFFFNKDPFKIIPNYKTIFNISENYPNRVKVFYIVEMPNCKPYTIYTKYNKHKYSHYLHIKAKKEYEKIIN